MEMILLSHYSMHFNWLKSGTVILGLIFTWPTLRLKGNTKFWYGVMNLVHMNILEAYAILQYSVIVVVVEIESKVMKL